MRKGMSTLYCFNSICHVYQFILIFNKFDKNDKNRPHLDHLQSKNVSFCVDSFTVSQGWPAILCQFFIDHHYLSNHSYRGSIYQLSVTLQNDTGHLLTSAGVCCSGSMWLNCPIKRSAKCFRFV